MAELQPDTAAFVVKPLSAETWDAYARMMERHNGVFGGCWCTWFHTLQSEKTYDAGDNRALKERLVKEGRACAALVVEGYPHDNDGKKISVLYNSTRALYEREGFSYVRPKGLRNCVMRTTVI